MKHLVYFILVVFIFSGCNKNIPITNTKVGQTQDDIDKQYTAYSSSDIAIVFPSQTIGKYAIDATNSAMSYLIYKNKDFNLKVFDTVDETQQSIKDTFQKISNQGISKVLVLLTHNGVKHLNTIENINSYEIYLPLIHKDDLNLDMNNVVFGSIDYLKQFNELVKYSNGKLVEFHDNSNLGNRLANSLNNSNIEVGYQKEVDNDNGEYYKFLTKRNKRLKDSTLMVNMPIVKSSIVLSQINANDIEISKILSTQLNYTPLLLSLTQIEDRKNMIIASSIGTTNETVEEYNALLDNDIVYNWVNYSVIIGMEYLISKDISSFKSVTIKNQQVHYPVSLYTTTKYALKQLN